MGASLMSGLLAFPWTPGGRRWALVSGLQAHAPGRVVNIAFSTPGQVANQQVFDQADF